MPSLLELRAPALSIVRIGLVGLGQRGRRMMERYAFIEGAQITAIADTSAEAVETATQLLVQSHRPAPIARSGEEAWRELCELTEVDLVYICTPWDSHAEMALTAMRAGKHVAVEVPAAMTVADCWALVETARATQRHLFLAENCCYDRFHLGVLAAVRRGELGEVTHCEGAYLHDLRADFGLTAGVRGSRGWMGRAFARHRGNPYPTHAVGPMAHLLNIHRGDRFVSLTSLSSTPIDEATGQGRINTTLLRTARGKTLLLQLDMTTPRPYSRLQTVCGTQGFAQKYPVPTFSSALTEGILTEATAEEFIARGASACPAFAQWQAGHSQGVDNEMNYAMDARLIYCLRRGLPLDIDAYDAAEWSALTELTERSAAQGGAIVEVPDFTQGHWDELTTQRFHA